MGRQTVASYMWAEYTFPCQAGNLTAMCLDNTPGQASGNVSLSGPAGTSRGGYGGAEHSRPVTHTVETAGLPHPLAPIPAGQKRPAAPRPRPPGLESRSSLPCR